MCTCKQEVTMCDSPHETNYRRSSRLKCVHSVLTY